MKMPSSRNKEEIKKLLDLVKGQNEKIDQIAKILVKIETDYDRAKTEQFSEQNEQLLASKTLEIIKGRHREVVALLMNDGFHTYGQLAKKLNISQSRARAYVTELKSFGLPLRQMRDAEGYKIGIDGRFVEKILAVK
jgi:biotin operon repressor